MKCKTCGKSHEKSHSHFNVEPRLSDKGFPTHSKGYKAAHREANKEEKAKFGEKPFKELEKYVQKAKKHELIGKNTKSGKIEVESKIPRALRSEVALHEKVENKALRKKK